MGSITDKANYLKETKRQIKTAIQDKGVEVSDTDTFRSYAAKINSIETTGTATSKVGDTLPIGSMVPYGNVNSPTGWLVCDGSAISRTTYAELFKVIGTSYGEGDGSTTFNLPNKKGRLSIGLDSSDTNFNSIGKTGGEKTHTLSVYELPTKIPVNYGNISGGTDVVISSSVVGTGGVKSGQANMNISATGQAHNNLQPYEVDCWIIKAFQSAGVVANVTEVQTDSNVDVYSCNYVNSLKTEIAELQAKINNSVAYCRMTINGTETIPPEGKIITSFVNPISYGGFVADKDNGYLFIPQGTKTIETFGMICGGGYFSARLEIKDADGAYLSTYNYTSGSILTQPSGNGYTATALPTSIIELDETKDWYIYIRISGYTQNSTVNDGFGTQTAWFGAKKVR